MKYFAKILFVLIPSTLPLSKKWLFHISILHIVYYNNVVMGVMTTQITGVSIIG